jgi:aminoglycoside phosphotransferase (APT) family kinase protein
MADDRGKLAAELVAWIEATAGGELARARRLPGGNRREAWAIDVEVDGQTQQLFLRHDPLDPVASGDVFTIHREAKFYAALRGSGVAIPGLKGVHPVWQTMLTERVGGRSDYSRVASQDEKREISLDLIRHLARLHKLDVAPLLARLPGSSGAIPELIAAEIALWEALYNQTGHRDPLIEFGLRWLRDHLPAVDEPPAIVHGDAGPGNFLFEGGEVTALLDWELTHLGDPLEDIAWLSMRTVLEPFPDFVACIAEYERASGRKVDLGRVRYHRVLVEWRVAIIRHRNQGEDVANSLISRALNRRLLVEAIAEASGRAAPTYEMIAAPEGPRDAMFEAALHYLRDIVAPAVGDTFARGKVKSVARIVKYLKEAERLGEIVERAEMAEIKGLIGEPTATIAEAREALAWRVREGSFDEVAAFAFLARHVGHDTQLMLDALGALAWRHFPPLEAAT